MKLGIAILLLLTAVTVAEAQSPTQTAKQHYQEGTKRYNLAEYGKALEEFKAAYLAKPDAAFLFNIAQCQRQLADYEAAAKSYRAFLRESSDLPAATREQVQKLVGDMEQAARDARAKAQQPPTGTVPPRDEPKPPPEAQPATQPPPAAVATPIEARAAPEQEQRPGRTLKIAGLALGIVGLVAIGVGAAMEGLASQAANDLTNASRNSQPFDRSRYSTGQSEDYAGIALLTVGAAAAVAGIAVGVIGLRQAKAARVAFAPWMTGNAAGAILEVRR